MKKRQINKLRMFRTVRDYVATLDEVLQSAPMYTQLMARFDGLLAALDVAADYQAHAARGKVAAHRAAQERMRAMLAVVGGIVHAHARVEGDMEFLLKTSVTPSALRKMRAEDALRLAEHIYSKAVTVKEELAPYWLDGADKIGEFRDVLDAAQEALRARYQGGVQQVSSSRAIASVVTEIETFLTDELDTFLEQYLQRDAAARIRYRIARQTHSYGIRRWRRPAVAPAALQLHGGAPEQGANSGLVAAGMAPAGATLDNRSSDAVAASARLTIVA
ncbi:MAG: hypothetical protein HY962_16885 [Ignavibacteriae bacterium]|nr:hypothetical protein [Ignavibacteriota bacterium]